MADTDIMDALPEGYQLHWYRIERVLGRGGFGITYLAKDTNLDHFVAIKEYLPSVCASRLPGDSSVKPLSSGQSQTYEWGLKAFITEAQTLAKFKHPNIVRVLSVFEQLGTAYMVMEYEPGVELADLIKQGKSFSEPELMTLTLTLLNGLGAVHAAGFIHRDIKPQNIVMRPDGSPVLLDFGSARKALEGKKRQLTSMVSSGYAPIEQYNQGDATQGPWTDLYGMAATLYSVMTGA
ncbi:MAG TPA: serine/threonine-protein kinase, partial [Pseudomonadales bacterium]|nr:serine/threonine-protein kinase [Pseudomonadales bacterium]